MEERMFRIERDMRPVVANWLHSQGFLAAFEFHIGHMVDIVAGRFGSRPARRRIPPLVECVAVELKLADVAGVIRQAKSNSHQTDWSWCAMPEGRCAIMRPSTRARFRDAGVGLLSVSDEVCVIVSPNPGSGAKKRVHKNLWRRVRDNYEQKGK